MPRLTVSSTTPAVVSSCEPSGIWSEPRSGTKRPEPGSRTSTTPCTATTFALSPATGAGGRKVASTPAGPSMRTVQGPTPEQAPVQPPNVQPGAGAGTSVTTVPFSKSAAQVTPQSMPGGALAIDPSPVLPTVSRDLGTTASKVVRVVNVALSPSASC